MNACHTGRSLRKIEQKEQLKNTSIIHASLWSKRNNQSRRIYPVSSLMPIHRSKASSEVSIDSNQTAKQNQHRSTYNSGSIDQVTHSLNREIYPKINDDSSTLGVIQNHHRRKEKTRFKCSAKTVVLMTTIGLTFVGVVAAVVTAVVLLTSQRKSTSIAKDAVLRWNPIGITVAGVTNVLGNTSDKLAFPMDLVLDYSSVLYIADRDNDRIQQYLPNGVVGTTMISSANGLLEPYGVDVDEQKNLYTTDPGHNRLVFWPLYASNGTILTLGVCRPYRLSFDDDTSNLYVVDYWNHRVCQFDHKTSATAVVAGNSGNGTNSSQLLLPTSVYFDTDSQSMIITNFGANNIVRWRLGDSSWTLLAGNASGSASGTPAGLRGPTSATMDPMGNLYVADRGNSRIQFFTAAQSSATTIAGITGVPGVNATLFNLPWSVALDSQLNLYVADSLNSRIQKFLRY